MAELNVHQQQLVEQRLANEVKSPLIAYLLWFFLAAIAAHRFYLGKAGSAVVMLLLCWVGIFTSFLGIGLVLLAAFGIWWIVDAFLIPSIIDADRHAKRVTIANEIRATMGSA